MIVVFPDQSHLLFYNQRGVSKIIAKRIEAPFLVLDLFINSGIVLSKFYDKRDGLNFEIVDVLFLSGDAPRSPSYGVYISQLIRFERICSNVSDFNNKNFFFNC